MKGNSSATADFGLPHEENFRGKTDHDCCMKSAAGENYSAELRTVDGNSVKVDYMTCRKKDSLYSDGGALDMVPLGIRLRPYRFHRKTLLVNNYSNTVE